MSFNQKEGCVTPSFGYEWLIRVYRELALKAGLLYQVPESLVLAVIKQESSGNPIAMSNAGAIGLMQMMKPALSDFNLKFHKEYELADMYRAVENIDAGTGYLSMKIAEMGGDVDLAIKAYNQGAARVKADHSKGQWYCDGVRKHEQAILKLLKPPGVTA